MLEMVTDLTLTRCFPGRVFKSFKGLILIPPSLGRGMRAGVLPWEVLTALAGRPGAGIRWRSFGERTPIGGR